MLLGCFCSVEPLHCLSDLNALVHQVLPLWAVLLVMTPIFVAGVRFIVVNRAPLAPAIVARMALCSKPK